jgi:hypothetical protein
MIAGSIRMEFQSGLLYYFAEPFPSLYMCLTQGRTMDTALWRRTDYS